MMLNRFDIDIAKCMYCGLCSEPCPTGSIHHTSEFEGADYSLESMLRRFVKAPVIAYKPKKGPETDPEIAPILDRCALLLRHQAEMLGINIAFETTPGLPRLHCDAAQIQQVVLALAMNALEATPAGGRVTVTARPDPEAHGIVITVSDTGCGIAEEDRERVFEPFFTTKAAGKGVGLGLAVVYGIVSRHRGRIDVQSRVGEGTVFTIRLPQRPPEEEP